jgi:RES domain-containing protein
MTAAIDRVSLSATLADFHRFLTEFPFLGLADEVGAAIARAVGALPTRDLEERTWFRGLAVSKGEPSARTFFPPDPRQVMVPEQRFNHQGQRVFYLSDSPRGAALECREKDDERIWVQKFLVPALDGIADLRCSDALLAAAATFCGEARDDIQRPPHLQPQYMVPRFVADCVRQAGIRGILVPSVQEGTNLVLFRWNDGDIRPVGAPVKFDL